MEPSDFYENIMPLPKNYCVLVYYSHKRNSYVLEVLKKKGWQFVHGGQYYPKWRMFSMLNDETVSQLKEMGLDLERIKKNKKEFLLYGSREFVDMIDVNPFFNKLVDDVLRSSNMTNKPFLD